MPPKPALIPRDLPGLRARVATLRLRGPATATTERARKLLLLYLDNAIAQNAPFADVAKALKSGLPAQRIAGIDLQQLAATPPEALRRAACAPGCAFCCILPGADGGTILETEARALHAALIPLRGQPDGVDWRPDACPALDPERRMCRAYDARPMICRTYFSTDAAACEAIAGGIPATGAAVLGAQGLMLSLHALARAALDGLASAPTYALAKLARATLDGADLPEALRLSRHPPRALEDERRRLTR